MNTLGELTYYRGRVALRALLKALGIGPGDEVALQAFTCVAVPEGIMAAGARPLYIDIESDGLNMDAADLQRKLTPQTKAIVVQHTFGIPAEMDALMPVASRAGIPVIEDCCHTLESSYRGRAAGTFGLGAFYSFEWGKPVVVGIGGAARLNDEALAARVRSEYSAYLEPPRWKVARLQVQYAAHCILYRPSLFWPVRTLYHRLGSLGAAESNYNPIQAGRIAGDFSWRMAAPLQSRLRRKLGRLAELTRHSREVAAQYQNGLRSPSVRLPTIPGGCDWVPCRFPLRAVDKPSLLRKARAANVELAEWYATPIHPLKREEWPLIHYQPGSCLAAEQRCVEIVTLPTHPTVSRADVRRAVNFINSL